MGLARWCYRVGPPSILVLTAMLVTAAIPTPFAAAVTPTRVDCRSLAASAAARSALTSTAGSVPSVSVQSQLGTRGDLTGRTLTAQSGLSTAMAVSLPSESFVGLPAGDLVVYTRYSSTTGSEVRALNPVTRCDVRLVAPPEIVRSAVLDRLATSAYVHSVTRVIRADAGVIRYDLPSGASTQVVDPLPQDDAFGRIFGTELRWSIDGSALAVQSCGFRACLTRVLDTSDGGVTTYDAAGQGAFIALTAERLVTYAACSGLPCAVLSTDLTTGAVSVLADEAFATRAIPTGADSVTLSMETDAGNVEVLQ